MLPSVTTALALAEALECQVADLFKKPVSEKPLGVTLSAAIHFQNGPVRLACIGDRWIAIPVTASESAGFGEADGQLLSREGRSGRVRTLLPEGQLQHNLLLAGCDPAFGIVRDLWKRCNMEGNVRWQDLPSLVALNALAHGEAHVAGVYFPDDASEQAALASLGLKVAVVRFARWELGWMVRQGNPLGFRSVEDLTSHRVRFLNQIDGSGSRLMVDQLLENAGVPASRIPLYSCVEETHFDCAKAIREGRADVAMGVKAVAESYDLDFLPVREIAFHLIIPRSLLDSAPVAHLLDLLRSQDLRKQLASLSGYTAVETGEQVAEG